ncbi:MAG: hypothetical protein KDB37_21730 [Ilumatobacter sp.]|nr:hypothetical protein [Ilumatobacter sp.]
MFALLRDTGYNIVLFLHVLTVIIAMAGAVAHPLMFTLEQKRADGDVVSLAQRIEVPSRIYSISYALVGIIGFGLVSMGDWPWGDAWIWISILLWVATNGLLHGAMLPAERAVAKGDTSAMAKIDKIGPILTVMILVIIFLMTVKPGGSAL